MDNRKKALVRLLAVRYGDVKVETTTTATRLMASMPTETISVTANGIAASYADLGRACRAYLGEINEYVNSLQDALRELEELEFSSTKTTAPNLPEYEYRLTGRTVMNYTIRLRATDMEAARQKLLDMGVVEFIDMLKETALAPLQDVETEVTSVGEV